MIFQQTTINGAYLIEAEPQLDERGFFSRTFCQMEFLDHGLNHVWKQCSISYNEKFGTLRGLHYQCNPHSEVKLVRVTRGSIYDVILDLRPESSSYKRWEAFNLTGQSYRQLYIPQGVAHGFQTLEDNTEVYYQVSESYHPESSRGVYYLDPSFSINWPILPPVAISEKDKLYSLWGGG